MCFLWYQDRMFTRLYRTHLNQADPSLHCKFYISLLSYSAKVWVVYVISTNRFIYDRKRSRSAGSKRFQSNARWRTSRNQHQVSQWQEGGHGNFKTTPITLQPTLYPKITINRIIWASVRIIVYRYPIHSANISLLIDYNILIMPHDTHIQYHRNQSHSLLRAGHRFAHFVHPAERVSQTAAAVPRTKIKPILRCRDSSRWRWRINRSAKKRPSSGIQVSAIRWTAACRL